MSEFLGNLAARALGLSAVARPRPSIFEPRRATPGPLALEPETVSVPQAARAEEAPRPPTRPKPDAARERGRASGATADTFSGDGGRSFAGSRVAG